MKDGVILRQAAYLHLRQDAPELCQGGLVEIGRPHNRVEPHHPAGKHVLAQGLAVGLAQLERASAGKIQDRDLGRSRVKPVKRSRLHFIVHVQMIIS